ncbi:response regulator transcription factor [Desulfocurvus sp. DL9XJH121]
MTFNIMIADDNKDFVEKCRKQLLELSSSIDIHYDANTAILQMQSMQHDIYIIDIKIPYVNAKKIINNKGGFILSKFVKDNYPDSHILFISGNADMEDINKVAQNYSEYLYINKGSEEDPIEEIADKVEIISKIIEKTNQEYESSPFASSPGASPSQTITDRTPVLKKILAAQEITHKSTPQCHLIAGDYCQGKTIHLRDIAKSLAKRERFAISYNTLHSISDEQDINGIINKMILGFDKSKPQIKEIIVNTLKKSGLKIKFPFIEASVPLDQIFTNDNSSILIKTIKALNTKGIIPVIIIDDFHIAYSSESIPKNLMEFIIPPEVTAKYHFIASLSKPSLRTWNSNTDYITKASSSNIFELQNFSKTQLKELVASCLMDSHVSFTTKTINKIHALTNGQPYLSTLLCHHIYEIIKLDGEKESLINEAIRRSVNESGIFFEHLYEDLSNEEKIIFEAISLCSISSNIKEIMCQLVYMDRIDLIGASQSMLNSLIKKDIIDNNNGAVRVKDRLFREITRIKLQDVQR